MAAPRAVELPSDLAMIAALRRELVAAQAELADARAALLSDERGDEPATVAFWRQRAQEACRQLRLEREQRVAAELRGRDAASRGTR